MIILFTAVNTERRWCKIIFVTVLHVVSSHLFKNKSVIRDFYKNFKVRRTLLSIHVR